MKHQKIGSSIGSRKATLKILKDSAYKWIGTDDDDVTTDVVNRINGNLIFLEFKFRVDSGCTAGRREVWETKFLKIIQHMVTGKKLFAKDSAQYSLIEILERARINVIEFYIGIFLISKVIQQLLRKIKNSSVMGKWRKAIKGF